MSHVPLDSLLGPSSSPLQCIPKCQAEILFARAEACRRQNDYAAAIADLREALTLDPERAGEIRAAVAAILRERGQVLADAAEWRAAAAEYSAAFELQPPEEPVVWFEHASLRLQVGDTEEYGNVCRQMYERWSRSKDVVAFSLLAHTCVLGPQALGEGSRVLELAEQRLALTPSPSPLHSWSAHLLGLAYYRAGRHEQAVQHLVPGLRTNPHWAYDLLDWLVLALADQQLGNDQEARKWLDQADGLITNRTQDRAGKGQLFSPPGWKWRDVLWLQLLRREYQGQRETNE